MCAVTISCLLARACDVMTSTLTLLIDSYNQGERMTSENDCAEEPSLQRLLELTSIKLVRETTQG
jgi:hypothetical protein